VLCTHVAQKQTASSAPQRKTCIKTKRVCVCLSLGDLQLVQICIHIR